MNVFILFLSALYACYRYLSNHHLGKEQKTATIRSAIEYEVDQEYASTPPVVSTSGLATIAKAITEYIKQKKGPE